MPPIKIYKENKFCYCRNRRRALWRKHSILLEKWIKQYKLGRIRQVAILNSPVVTSWRTESSNISLVVLDKLLYYSRNLIFYFQNLLKTDRPTNQPSNHVQIPPMADKIKSLLFKAQEKFKSAKLECLPNFLSSQ